MSMYKYYQLLESNEISLIINEKWHGKSSQMFGLFQPSKLYHIIQSNYDADEARRLFIFDTDIKKDNKIYIF